MGWLARGDAIRVYAALIFLNASDSVVGTITPPFLQSLGYPLATIGPLVAGYAVASLLSRFPAGRLADSRYAKQGFLVACTLYSLAMALYPIALEPWAFWGTRALHGFAQGTATTLNFAAFLAVSQNMNRARATSLYAATMSAGYAVGNFASGILADNFGYQTSYLSAAAFSIGALLMGFGRHLPADSSPRRAGTLSSWRALARADVRAIPLVAISVNLVLMILNTLFPLYVLAIGLSLTVAGTARGFHALTNVASRTIGEPLLKMLGVVGMAVAGLVVLAVSTALVPAVSSPELLVLLFIVVGFGRGMVVVANTLTTVNLSDRGILNRGSASAFMTVGQDLASIAGPVLATSTAAAIGIPGALVVLPIVVVSVGVAAMLSARTMHAPRAESSSRA